ncbi:MAG: AIPR family protein [Chloroflexota bacterium]
MGDIRPSLQDFSTINTYVKKYNENLELNDLSNGFYFLALDLLHDLQDDEIRDSITDSHFLNSTGREKGKDRGIDAVYINEDNGKANIHFYNFKYAYSFEKTQSHYPSGEIDKIISFINDVISKEEILLQQVNPILASKVEEIWQIFDMQNPDFHIHLCSNLYHGLEATEKHRFENSIHRHSNFRIHYHGISDFVNKLTRKERKVVNAKLPAIDRHFFEKSDGDIRALIVHIDIRDLIRIVLDDEQIREKVDIDDFTSIRKYRILEDAFEDNVRTYLKQRSKINRNIKYTATSEDRHRFFYYNNGITITCDNFSYPRTQRAPIIELSNLQVVNGSQTIHALYDAFIEDPEKFEDLDILCRIYQTNNSELSTRIAEYTNSQNPVSSRDIRSIDYIQQKLEQELKAKGFFYERKKNQYYHEPKSKRIDSEKSGQVLLAFYHGMPSEAKNQKKKIFAERYDDIFHDNVTADSLLLPYMLFERIEREKSRKKETLVRDVDDFERNSYI